MQVFAFDCSLVIPGGWIARFVTTAFLVRLEEAAVLAATTRLRDLVEGRHGGRAVAVCVAIAEEERIERRLATGLRLTAAATQAGMVR